MGPTRTLAPGDLLARVAGARQTGALVVKGHPGGAVYVLEGRVLYAESPAAPGVGELLTSSGRLAGRTWQSALDLGTSTARVGRLLVEQGHLTQGELELCVLGATYDAAYFVLSDDAAPAEFLAGAMHWLGPVVHIDAAAVEREVRRRIQLLDEIFPNPRIDVAPVIPVTRPPRERVTVTAPQWEVLVHADGQRTPADLAQLLGRAGYAIIAELRRMAAAGLIEPPETKAPEGPEFVRLPHPRGASVPVSRSAPAGSVPASPASASPVPADSAPASPVPVISGPEPAARNPPPVGDPPPAPPPPGDGNAGMNRPPRLARRKPGAKLPKEFAGESPPAHQGADEVLLKRIRTALRALR
ncbi:DUF4388 domain-containing protein [Actinoplanes utahensis]|uniref:ADAM 12 protein n=1 Tax=Actinoplanes utahensis TaxID=1869 RepID=A0A0A6UKW8_ACTUT|nr:DUF4388 domain-containing protein [Actinoplanes utahensis]KHD76091.1 ADAM 12 protein [Actinoplanes utahensis]GIF34773.1 hypothetical protein Aut01nite_77590 [Actinoplanes utahensis]